MPPIFRDFDLKMVEPAFGSELTDLVMELQYLKRFQLIGQTPPYIFFQLKDIFHLLESLASARIEGNRTTIAELVEARIDPPAEKPQNLLEIDNMGRAMSFIDEVVQESQGISKAFILELHKQTVENLTVEGDPTPGHLRQANVAITGSQHAPPDYTQVGGYIDELIAFVNRDGDAKYDLLKIALTHHRFAWIHPFRNGNGRVVRLLTYAMLIERGFNVRQGRILNPSAVFCSDREQYYSMLSEADTGSDEGLLRWCEFVLRGLRDELVKIDKLLDYNYLAPHILMPAVGFCRERELVTDREARALMIAIQQRQFKARDLSSIVPQSSVERSRFIGRLRARRLIKPVSEGSRRYILSFSNSSLLRGIITALQREDFITLGND